MAPGLDLPPPKQSSDVAEEAEAGPSTSRPRATVEDVDEVTEASTSAAAAKPKFATGGIIYPPPDIRTIVDKTAAFVARNGASFEAKIRGDERANTKFAFMNDGDPFNAYYRAKIEAVRDGTGPLAAASTSDLPGGASQAQSGPGGGQLVRVDGEDAMDEERERQDATRPPEPRPTIFTADMPNITAVDFDIIKLTALFVAKKGRSFATTLLAKEANSYQFEFLRPKHSLFGFFNRLVEQYRLVIDPPEDVMQALRAEAGSPPEKLGMGAGGARQQVLKQARERAAWEKWMDERRKKQADQEEEEKAAFAEIDWQDFVVVGTVEITESDAHIDLPVPMSLREVENMTMAQKRMASMIMEEEGVDEGEAIEQVGLVDLPGPEASRAGESGPTAPPPPPADDDDEMQMEDSDDESDAESAAPAMKIRKDYVPKTLAERQAATAQKTVCPVCGESIPTSEMDEHVKIELLNPKYREQRAELEAKRAQHAALTSGADPSKFLRSFAGARTDIFGLQSQEEVLARKEEEDRQRAKAKERIIWDGHAASRGRVREDFNRSDQVESTMRDIQGRFKPKDTESIGPQVRPGGEPGAAAAAASGSASPYVPAPGAPTPTPAPSGTKRPAESDQFAHAQGPPSQRPAFEGANGSPAPAPAPAPGGTATPPVGPRGGTPGVGMGTGMGGIPSGPRAGMGMPGAPGMGMGYAPPPAPDAPPAQLISVTLLLPPATTPATTPSTSKSALFYGDLPPSTTVASLRDRVQAEAFPSLGASRIKLRWKRKGRMLNLKQTLGEVGMGVGEAHGQGGEGQEGAGGAEKGAGTGTGTGTEEVEVIVK